MLSEEFERLLRGYNSMPSCSVRRFTFARMVKSASSFDDWSVVYGLSDYYSDAGKKAMHEMVNSASSFNEWKVVHELPECNADIRKRSVQAMANSADSFYEWSIVCESSDLYPDIRKHAMQKMIGLAVTFQEWAIVYELSDCCSDASKEAMLRMQMSTEIDAPLERIVYVIKDMGDMSQDELFEKMNSKEAVLDTKLFILAFGREESSLYKELYTQLVATEYDHDEEWMNRDVLHKKDEVMVEFLNRYNKQSDLEYVLDMFEENQNSRSYKIASNELSEILNSGTWTLRSWSFILQLFLFFLLANSKIISISKITLYHLYTMEDLQSFQEFFDYKPCYDQDPVDILDNILRKAKKYLKPEEIEDIIKTYEFTREAHKGVLRKSGEPYIIHPLRATEFLMEINPDAVSIQACILHDVIEDTDYTYEDIEKLFGKEIADICEGLVKVSKVRYKGEDRDLETIKKTFLAMAKDLRVIFIKFADRIHNIQTLQYHPEEEKRRKIATETLKIYAPVAKRLGLYNYQLYLENGSFRVLEPEKFEEIMGYLTKLFQNGSKFLDKGIKNLTEILKQEGIEDFEVLGRIKSPFRIFEKMDKKYHTDDVSRIMDLLAFRVVTGTVTDCYMILGIIHKYYTPLIKKIKDYIALPKFNGYKSIHTTILGMFNFPVEIQIRTKKMDEIAEYGVAAHFAYAENNGSVSASSQQGAWIQRLQKIVSEYTGTEDKDKFKDALSIEILDKTIFVYTPKGDIKELPAGSSVLDFAFSIHSEIGLKFKNAIVNGQIKPLSYILRTGDIVNINTFKNRYSAVKHWIDYLHTPSARGQLIKYVRMQEREVRLDEAIDGLNQYLKNLNLPSFRSDADLIQKLGEPIEVERRLLQVLDKQETYGGLVRAAYPNLQKETQGKTLISDVSIYEKELKAEVTSSISGQATSSDVIVDSDKLLHCVFCPECNPNFGDKIIAKSSREGIKIHSLSCKALKTLSYTSLLEAHRKNGEPASYVLHMQLKFSQKKMSIIDIIAMFSTFSIPIFKFELEKVDGKMTIATIEGDISNPAKIGFLLADIRQNHPGLEVIHKELS